MTGANRSITHIITDIEGTTTAIDFVYKSLFPYARQHLRDYLKKHFSESNLQPILEEARAEATSCDYAEPLDSSDDFAALFESWMAADKKITPLKSLQGHIWRAGYQSGALRGHLYLDAVDCLQRWQMEGYTLGIYSSGSVAAQKLLFGHSEYGDLTPLFAHYFDTHIGHKREPQAYQNIAQAVLNAGETTEQILFLSDIVEELDAAKAAGLSTFGLVRDAELETKSDERAASKVPNELGALGEHKSAQTFTAIDVWLRSNN